MNSLFVDVLGAMIGVVTVLVMLSMVVTALVQATQGVLRLRSRNLLFGLTSVIAKQADLGREEAKEKAHEILNAKSAPAFTGIFDPKGDIGKKIGPQVSWIKKSELENVLNECTTILDTQARADILRGWDAVQNALSRRFLRNIRIWTVLWAAVVAVYFQVSTPALLSDLFKAQDSTQPAVQVQPFEEIQAKLKENQKLNYEDVSKRFLDMMSASHPNLGEQLKKDANQDSGEGNISVRLMQVLKNDPQRDKIVGQYEDMVEQQYLTQLKATLDSYDTLQRSLSRLNVVPWSESWAYYVRNGEIRWQNCVGVSITLILLTFGAPFWFNVLRYLVNLRDTLKPMSKKKPNSTDQDTEQTRTQVTTGAVSQP